MNKDTFILPPSERPNWVEYPHSFCRIVEQQLIHLIPWHIMEGERALRQFRGLAERYPSRELFPFAYRQDNDDVACWAKGMGDKVFIIHDFASPGFENEGAFDDVWSWFRAAVDETISWD
ncbi:MAG: hypothetical protein HY267_05180 [Deltaproteobacteria bacterium]|nr:hypothetical protein [Deltaproteobacteria bacterium]